MEMPDSFIEICEEEVIRGKLFSNPRKLEFAKERGMQSLDEVHAWMVKTRRNFIEIVETLKVTK